MFNYRTFLGATRLTVLWLGVSLFATGAGATTIPTPVTQVAPEAGAAAPAPKKTSATARARARAARIRAARAKVGEGPGRGEDPSISHRRSRQRGARNPGRRRHHLRPGDRQGALRREFPGRAVDRQHHEGDDRDRVPRDRDRPQPGSPDCALGHAARLDDLSAHQRSRAPVGPAAPAADSVGQRGGPRAGPSLAAGL